MVGVSASMHDREHWLYMANRLGSRASTLENRLVMALMLTFSSLDEKCLLVSNPQDIHRESIVRHYNAVMQYLNECEEVTYYCANTLGFIGPHNIVTSFQAVIFSCKCFIQSKCDNNPHGIAQYAQHAISQASLLTEPSAPVIVCLARVLQVLQDPALTVLSTEGFKVLCNLGRKVPYCNRLFEPVFQAVSEASSLCPEICSSIIRAICSAPSPLSFSNITLQSNHISCTQRVYLQHSVGCPLDPLFPSHPDLMMLDEPIDPRPFKGQSFCFPNTEPLPLNIFGLDGMDSVEVDSKPTV